MGQTRVSTTPKVNILDVGISAINQDLALQQIDTWIEKGDKQYVSVCNVHTIMECQNDLSVRRAVSGAGMATPDCTPLIGLPVGKVTSLLNAYMAPIRRLPFVNVRLKAVTNTSFEWGRRRPGITGGRNEGSVSGFTGRQLLFSSFS